MLRNKFDNDVFIQNENMHTVINIKRIYQKRIGYLKKISNLVNITKKLIRTNSYENSEYIC